MRGWLAREQVRKARALRRAYIRGRTLAGELVAARPGDPLGLIEQNREEYLETVEEMQFWKACGPVALLGVGMGDWPRPAGGPPIGGGGLPYPKRCHPSSAPRKEEQLLLF